MLLADLDTPALVADLDIVQRNVRRMADLARRGGKSLRPHVKTHKSPDLARLQLAAGATGITVAKLGEAEVMADAGFNDLFLANEPATEVKATRLAILVRRARVAAGVDSLEGAAILSRAAARAGVVVGIRIEVDTGLGRCGVRTAEAALEIARAVCDSPGLRLEGIFTHEGHVYRASPEEVRTACVGAAARMREVAEVLRTEGLPCGLVSVGSTPGAAAMADEPGIDEMRPGVYVFNDGMQAALGSAREEDCGLTVLASVISRPEAQIAILDAGSKALSSDRAESGSRHGAILGLPQARIDWLSEEHAHVDLRGVPAAARPRLGEKVRIVPHHACACVNLHSYMVVARADRVQDRWPIAARGRMQ